MKYVFRVVKSPMVYLCNYQLFFGIRYDFVNTANLLCIILSLRYSFGWYKKTFFITRLHELREKETNYLP